MALCRCTSHHMLLARVEYLHLVAKGLTCKEQGSISAALTAAPKGGMGAAVLPAEWGMAQIMVGRDLGRSGVKMVAGVEGMATRVPFTQTNAGTGLEEGVVAGETGISLAAGWVGRGSNFVSQMTA